MSNDDHLDSDLLPPHIADALHNVAPATNEVRDSQIAEAMSHLAVSSRSPRSSWLSVAAASLILLAGGVIIGRVSSGSKSTNIASASGTTPTSVVAKGNVDTSTTIVPLCADRVEGQYIGTYSSSGTQWLMYASGATLSVVNAANCAIASQMPLPTSP